jgi:parallel beta-helix repeat protein
MLFYGKRAIKIIGIANKKYLSSLCLVLMLPLLADATVLNKKAIAQTNVPEATIESLTIYVDPEAGDDSQSGDSQDTALKTITKALAIAESGTTIELAWGTYSEATGEVFPLVIKENITLKGSPGSQGHNIVIEGNGYLITHTGGGQNVTIAALKEAGGIMGVTVINPHARGHGLWIEEANPAVVGNTFTNNGNTGVSINGDSSPLIENNYFYNNGGNGLLVYGTSQAEIKNNLFEKTGFGVSAVQNSSLLLTDNQFKGNRIGIILEGEARGILRNNTIEASQESGLTAISQSQVDLGSSEQPGNNTFSRNGQLDIQNASSNEIVAVGNQTEGKTTGKIDFNEGESLAFVPQSDRDLPVISSSLVKNKTPDPESDPLLNPPTDTNSNQQELVFNAPNSSQPVPFPPETDSQETLPSPPEIASNSQLPAPSSSVGSLSAVLSSSPETIRYKVLVETDSDRQELQVRSLYPEAFATIDEGKSVLQVGAFSSRDKADRAKESLEDLGLDSYILE